MKLLVSGCSFSSGFGFNSTTLERNWPNQLATFLKATLTNVAQPGYDNPGIFINFMEQITKEDFDVCLLQMSGIDRIVLSPNWNGFRLCSAINISNGVLSDNEYNSWYKRFLILNQHCVHWDKLRKILTIIENLNNQGKYIRVINGLLGWDQELFTHPAKSKFLNRLIDIDNIPDGDIDRLRTLVYNQTKSIDLNLWINPFNSFIDLQIDNILPNDSHPGLKSHDIYAELVFNYLTENKNA